MSATKTILYLTGCMMLVNTGLFHYASMTQYFVFCVAGLVALTMGLYRVIRIKGWHHSTMLEMLFFGWIMFIILHGILGTNEQYSLHYLLALWMFFQGLVWMMRGESSTTAINNLFIALGGYEAIVCILQQTRIITSHSTLFLVTGSWESPNMTAMFMALCIPYSIERMLSAHKLYIKGIGTTTLLIQIAALLFINCRTAYIAFIISTVILCGHHFQWKQLLQKWPKKRIVYTTLLLIILAIGGTFGLYRMKAASANGRTFIWKTTFSLIKQKPFIGHGYGLFEKEYNLRQASYFQTDIGTEEEKQNARHIFMCYNDYLEQAVEGGILSAVFYLSIILLTIHRSLQQKDYVNTVIMVNLFWMSSVNFVLQSPPLMFVVLIIMAQTSAKEKEKQKYSTVIRFFSILFAISLILMEPNSIFNRYQVQRTVKNALILSKTNSTAALKLLESNKHHAGTSECFWRIYGIALMHQKRNIEAKFALKKALQYTSSPLVINNLIICHQRLGEQAEAKKLLKLWDNMIPTRKREINGKKLKEKKWS